METSRDFLARIKKLFPNETHSDYATAKLLGITRSTMSAHKVGKAAAFGEETGERIAQLLELDPAYVQACLAAERAKRPDVRVTWQRVAAAFAAAKSAGKRVAMWLIGFAIVSAMAGMPAPSQASSAGSFLTGENIHYTQFMRALWAWLAGIFRGCLMPGASRMMRGLREHARMRTIITGAFLFGLSLSAQAADPWTPTQQTLAATSTAALAVDWGQTLDISNHPGLFETNPILGRHPTRAQINRYFASSIVGSLAVAHLLPSRFRTTWLSAVTMLEVSVSAHNYQIGVGLNF